MAYKNFSILAFLLALNILSGFALAGRDIATKTSKTVDRKLPKSFIHDGTVLVPGLGRFYVFPRPGTNFNPFTYNPVTGTSGGTGFSVPGGGDSGSGSGSGSTSGGSTGGGGSYVPGGDDTLLPNPGVEVPNPSGSSSTAPPDSP